MQSNATVADRRQNGRGILLMGAGMFLFAAVDTMAKLMTERYHPIEIVWIRQLGLLFGTAILFTRFGPDLFRSARPGLQILRGTCAIISATAFIAAVAHVELADAVAVSFVAPFIVTLVGAFFLGEAVGLRRWTAVTIGFLATLVIIRPGTGVMHPAIFLVLLAASIFALRQILSRILGGVDSTATTVAYTAITGSILISLPLPFVWVWPQGSDWGIFAAIALIAGVAEALVIRALVVAESVAVAPVHYTILIWSTAYGFLVWGDLPDGWTLFGATIIIATGLYTLHRERLAEKARRATA